MDELCKTRLKACWSYETGRRWREQLLPEEQEYVSGLDRDYDIGVPSVCAAFLTREKVLARLERERTQKSSPAAATTGLHENAKRHFGKQTQYTKLRRACQAPGNPRQRPQYAERAEA